MYVTADDSTSIHFSPRPRCSVNRVVFSVPLSVQDVVKSVTKQTAAGLKFIHDKDVVHRDLKAENVLASRRFSVECLEGFVHGKSHGKNGMMIWEYPHYAISGNLSLSIYIYT